MLPFYRSFRRLVTVLLSYRYGLSARINDRSRLQGYPGEYHEGAEPAGIRFPAVGRNGSQLQCFDPAPDRIPASRKKSGSILSQSGVFVGKNSGKCLRRQMILLVWIRTTTKLTMLLTAGN